MAKFFEVVFVDKIVGSDRRVVVEWVCLSSPDPNFNEVVKRGRAKICKYLNCDSEELIFRSFRII